MFEKNTNYFYAVRIGISLATLSEILIQIGYFFTSYARKQKWLVFLNTLYRPIYSKTHLFALLSTFLNVLYLLLPSYFIKTANIT